MSTIEVVSDLLSESLNKEPNDFPENMRELEVIEFIMAIEDKFKIDLVDDDIMETNNFDDLISLIESQIKSKAA